LHNLSSIQPSFRGPLRAHGAFVLLQLTINALNTKSTIYPLKFANLLADPVRVYFLAHRFSPRDIDESLLMNQGRKRAFSFRD
jgi:hypothetical protein